MEIQIRQATIQDLNVLMQWRMEVLHEVFSIPSERSVTELESENRRYYQTELPQGGHIACFAYVGEEIVGCGGICLYHEMPSPDNLKREMCLPDEHLYPAAVSRTRHREQNRQVACRAGSSAAYFKNIS